MKFHDYPSQNFNDRKSPVDMIVIHYTGMRSTEDALLRLSDPIAKVSCHYLIDEEGKIYKMVDEDKRAWHAGESSWHGKADINSRSIGIELSNRGIEEFPREQIHALILLCHDIAKRHDILPHNIVGHSDIAPARKADPGPKFPWKALAGAGIGLMPRPTLREYFNHTARDERKLKRLLKDAGYDETLPLKTLLTAFQSHFHQSAFNDSAKRGKPTTRTVAMLKAVARWHRANGK